MKTCLLVLLEIFILSEMQCFWFNIHLFISNILLFLMLFFESLIWYSKHLIRLSKHGLDFVVKILSWYKGWWWFSNSGGFSRWSVFLTGDGSCVCGGIHNERYIFFGDYILLCFCLKLRVLLTVSVIFR